MKHFPQVMSANPTPLIQAMFDPFVALGVVALILALVVRRALRSLADLSRRNFCCGKVGAPRALGTAIVLCGAILVGRSVAGHAIFDGNELPFADVIIRAAPANPLTQEASHPDEECHGIPQRDEGHLFPEARLF